MTSIEFVAAGVAIFVFTFVLRAAPRLLLDGNVPHGRFALDGDFSDSMVHLIMADIVRRNGGRVPLQTDQFLLGQINDYPMFFHRLMALLPRARLERFEWAVVPVIEAVHGIIMFAFLAFFLPQVSADWTGAAWPLLAACCVVLTPLLSLPMRRNGFFLGERPFGMVLGAASLSSLAAFEAGGGAGWVVATWLCFTLVCVSSKFAIQAFVFIGVLIGVLSGSWQTILVALTALPVAGAISFGYGFVVLRGCLRHIRWYSCFGKLVNGSTRGFKNADLVTAARHFVAGRFSEAAVSMRRHPLGGFLPLFPWLVPVTLATWNWFESPTSAAAGGPVVAVLLAWCWSAVIVGMLTTLDFAKHLGEGVRYLEFGLLPAVALVFTIPPSLGGFWWLAVIVPGLFPFWRELRSPVTLQPRYPELCDLVRWFQGVEPRTILAYPGRLVFPILYGAGKHRALWLLANIDEGERQITFSRLFSRHRLYPFPDPETVAEAKQLGADTIVVWKAGIKSTEEHHPGVRYDFTALTCQYDNGHFAVFVAENALADGQRISGKPIKMRADNQYAGDGVTTCGPF